ncbi:unnamed protein product [Rotaria socialis]|uniref:G-protein coupled receptors family 1 profile domain-containing protein n=1 Tax=Rotaria socialis TaxID=392032 RepID=A0A821PBH8_9BILA|nr:unnamed protein product [Rotaria socialis]
MLFNRVSRIALHNHIIIAITVLNFICLSTNVPSLLYIYRNGVVWLEVPFFCRIWKFIDAVTYVGVARLVAWASIERHILIFHDQWVLTRAKRTLIHYIPIILILVYTTMCYLIINVTISCNIQYYESFPFCTYSSCAYNFTLALVEFATSGIPNALIIAFFSVGLMIRVIRQKKLPQ